MTRSISGIRNDYHLRELNEADLKKDPIEQFQLWLNEAIEAKVNEPTAMTLATSTSDGKPSARIVLLKKVNQTGFTFFTNYNSKKANQINSNPFAALVFFWAELERQVRIEGRIEKIPADESDAYFFSRPEGSKLGAWASPQSKKIKDRTYLENMVMKYQMQFGNNITRRPKYWGGYLLKPDIIEFWQGRSNRLHDRIEYSHLNGRWILERLAP
ncbi:MAG: pyridoxamine 5'-phosphate oxidase [Bacteroidota bacterium]|nr:pyridoxamine 5'-phosphate oxidase [Bacteroidota bacterium]MDP4192363.1 pyridoxamine 5'-phosphate oxidase [Bacteroidota bacterium]MDP4194330.1 pyridoxamine 5'-phosphate oxidase [Bacteroidota bacterium]